MNKFRSLYMVTSLLFATLLLLASLAWAQPSPDSLYIGDESDNSVKRFNATTWAYQGEFVKSTGGLKGPMGMVFNSDGDLIVVSQHVNTSANGSIVAYSPTGKLLPAIVPQDSPTSPEVPRGIILTDKLFVADFLGGSNDKKGLLPGWLQVYTDTGSFLGKFAPPAGALPAGTEFHPRGVVLGPDGYVYVSNYANLTTGLGGQVVRFNATTGAFVGIFITSSGGSSCNCVNELNRPEGLVFGPDGNLYITSFRASATDNDKILIFNGTTGTFVGHIELDAVGQPRATAQALLFGPAGRLFLPISNTGAVRSYDVTAKTYVDVVPPGGPLGAGFYLTFGETNPATLAYGN